MNNEWRLSAKGNLYIKINERLPVAGKNLYRWWAGVKVGEHPEPVNLKWRCISWQETVIDQLIKEVTDGGAL